MLPSGLGKTGGLAFQWASPSLYSSDYGTYLTEGTTERTCQLERNVKRAENADIFDAVGYFAGVLPARERMGEAMSFRVGQEVVCVDDTLSTDRGLKKGNVYTVAEIGISSLSDTPIVKLVETSPRQQFWQSRFRPIVKTDISIFTEMLAPSPKQRVDADA